MGNFWMGLKFKFPLIWLPIEKYQPHFHLNRYGEHSWTTHLVSNQGYRKDDEDTVGTYDFTRLHQKHASAIIDEDPEDSKGTT